jgi:hypothetical protein
MGIELIVGAIVVFVIGVVVGDRSASTIDAAITKVNAYEKQAQAVLNKITNHKIASEYRSIP